MYIGLARKFTLVENQGGSSTWRRCQVSLLGDEKRVTSNSIKR